MASSLSEQIGQGFGQIGQGVGSLAEGNRELSPIQQMYADMINGKFSPKQTAARIRLSQGQGPSAGPQQMRGAVPGVPQVGAPPAQAVPGQEGALSPQAMSMASSAPMGMGGAESGRAMLSPARASPQELLAARRPRNQREYGEMMQGAAAVHALAPKGLSLDEQVELDRRKNEQSLPGRIKVAEAGNAGRLEVEELRQQNQNLRAQGERRMKTDQFDAKLQIDKDKAAQYKKQSDALIDRYRAMNAKDRAKAAAGSGDGAKDRAAVQRMIANMRSSAANLMRGAASSFDDDTDAVRKATAEADKLFKSADAMEEQWKSVLGSDVLDVGVDDPTDDLAPLPGRQGGRRVDPDTGMEEAAPGENEAEFGIPAGSGQRMIDQDGDGAPDEFGMQYRRAKDGSILVRSKDGRVRRLA
jgi:hypothetical protein